jgi:hypothetical protein
MIKLGGDYSRRIRGSGLPDCMNSLAIEIVQQPKAARVCGRIVADRRMLDPVLCCLTQTPIVQVWDTSTGAKILYPYE